MNREQIIETMARAIYRNYSRPDDTWGTRSARKDPVHRVCNQDAAAALSALESAGLVVVPYGQCNHSGECKAAQVKP